MKILVLIPAFNEEKNIEQTVKSVLAKKPESVVLVVDDGSQDQTAQIALKTGAIVLSHSFNLGYGVALQTGYKYALTRNFDLIVQMDADGQHDPRFIGDLIKPLSKDEADLVIGSRFLRYSYKMPLVKKIGILIFRFLIRVITDYKITDPTSGYRAFKPTLLKILVTDIYPTDFPDADLLITLIRGGVRVKEVPVKMYQPPKNKKPMHQGIVAFYYIFKVFLSVLIGLLRSKEIKN